MGTTLLPQVTTHFHQQLQSSYGDHPLGDTIRLCMEDAAARVKAGHTKEHLSTNTGLRAFASEAGGCERAIGLRMLDLKPLTITPELATTFLGGDLLHDHMQKALAALFPGFQAELPWYQDHVSGRADGVYGDTIVEIKSCSPSAFKFSLWKGPKADHILQAALSAHHLGKQHLHIIYIAKEPVSLPRKQWANPTIPETISVMDWLLPLNEDAAAEEWERLSTLAKTLAAGTLGDTETPNEWIEDPNQQKWPCTYCAAKPLCLTLGPGPQPLSRLQVLLPAHPFPDLTLHGE